MSRPRNNCKTPNSWPISKGEKPATVKCSSGMPEMRASSIVPWASNCIDFSSGILFMSNSAAAFYLHRMHGGRKNINRGMQKSFYRGKKPANIFTSAKKSLVGVVLGFRRLVGKISLAFSVLAETFVAKLNNNGAHWK